ncbi:MAG: ABC transporter substrate-binding protein [Acidobacteria bacterium]|nr:ABC transporter substrate-binding protein [Acidobacteriota bacterium]
MTQRKLTVGTFTPSILIHMARESKGFERAGLDVHESLVASSPAQFQSLERGELDVVFTSPDNVLAYQYLSKNPLGRLIPLRILGALDRGVGLSLTLGPQLNDVEQVRGKIVGVDVPQSGFAFVAYELLARCGLEPTSYELQALGSTPQRATALVESRCAATVLNAGNELRARGLGCTSVSEVGELGPYIGTVIAALPSSDSETKDLRQRFCDVILETARDILAGARMSEVVDAAIYLLDLDESQAREHHACLSESPSGLIDDGVVDVTALATLIDLRRKYMPTPELDVILESIDDILIGSARP